jgi:hypothetical protein
MTRAIERVSAIGTTRRRRNLIEEGMPNKSRREKTFAVGRRAAGRNWPVKAVLATGVGWERRAGLEIAAAWATKEVLGIGERSATKAD